MATKKLGMIGLIGHAGVIMNDVKEMKDIELTAVCADDRAAFENWREKGVVGAETRFYADYREMCEKEDLDIVGISNEDHQRAGAIIAAADSGAHVITEKPLAKTTEELDQVKSSIEKAGVEMTMLLTMRQDPFFMAARKVMEEGLIGEVAQITGQKSYRLGKRADWLKSRETFAGVIPFVGVHIIDLMRWISGREFVEAMAYGSNVTKPEIGEMEDNASSVMKMDNGGSATLRIDFLRPASAPSHGDDRLRMAGADGVLEVINGADKATTVILPDKGIWQPELPEKEPFFQKFVGYIDGKCDTPVPAEDCYRATEICLLIRQAQDEGRIVSLVR